MFNRLDGTKFCLKPNFVKKSYENDGNKRYQISKEPFSRLD